MTLHEWLNETLGEATTTLVYYALAGIAALLVLWVLLFWARRLSGGITGGRKRGQQRRLAVVDAIAIDNHRRLVLLRRDDVEHLVMIGGHNDFVVERDIGPAHLHGNEPAVAHQRTGTATTPSAASRTDHDETGDAGLDRQSGREADARGSVDSEMNRLLSELTHEKK